jgi:hypothetical protein
VHGKSVAGKDQVKFRCVAAFSKLANQSQVLPEGVQRHVAAKSDFMNLVIQPDAQGIVGKRPQMQITDDGYH